MARGHLERPNRARARQEEWGYVVPGPNRLAQHQTLNAREAALPRAVVPKSRTGSTTRRSVPRKARGAQGSANEEEEDFHELTGAEVEQPVGLRVAREALVNAVQSVDVGLSRWEARPDAHNRSQ